MIIVLAAAYFCYLAIIGADGLNCCVRDGNRCDPIAQATKTLIIFIKIQQLIGYKTYQAHLSALVVRSTD